MVVCGRPKSDYHGDRRPRDRVDALSNAGTVAGSATAAASSKAGFCYPEAVRIFRPAAARQHGRMDFLRRTGEFYDPPPTDLA